VLKRSSKGVDQSRRLQLRSRQNGEMEFSCGHKILPLADIRKIQIVSEDGVSPATEAGGAGTWILLVADKRSKSQDMLVGQKGDRAAQDCREISQIMGSMVRWDRQAVDEQ